MFTPSTTPEPSDNYSKTTTTDKVKIIVSPELLPLIKSKSKGELYGHLSSDDKARVAIVTAFAKSPSYFLDQYKVLGVLGFGSNGVVLGARHYASHQSVAIKVIYKSYPSAFEEFPSEIEILKELATSLTSTLLYLDSWQDTHHFYIVTQLFGTNWLQNVPQSRLPPMLFQSVSNGITQTHKFAFSSGSCDLWAWQNAMRGHQRNTEGHTLLPYHPVKHIIRETARALQSLHQAGYYHGDIKVENILVENDVALGDCAYPKVLLADMGHANTIDHGMLRYGTNEVSPPEFLKDSPFSHIDGRSADVFALGIVLFVLLSELGTLPTRLLGATYKYLIKVDDGRYLFDDLDMDDGAWDLLNAMCWVDPTRRISLDDILKHPWLNSE
ncbi:UNVERIFIED_CONTAM: hypothetical protein HDU68_000192 [Siphonaria sp. JEL0065]|nr:hypothetical protein HDU68_000192 [Siphonaria sp. JEL0065]